MENPKTEPRKHLFLLVLGERAFQMPLVEQQPCWWGLGMGILGWEQTH